MALPATIASRRAMSAKPVSTIENREAAKRVSESLDVVRVEAGFD